MTILPTAGPGVVWGAPHMAHHIQRTISGRIARLWPTMAGHGCRRSLAVRCYADDGLARGEPGRRAMDVMDVDRRTGEARPPCGPREAGRWLRQQLRTT